MDPQASIARRPQLGQIVGISLGLGLLSLGARVFFLRGHFGFADAFDVLLLLIPAAALLFVTSYVLQHAMFAALIPVAFAGVLAYAYPEFELALGCVLLGAVAAPAVREWKSARAP